MNYDEAHDWFHLAAEEGNPNAQLNLGIFHSRAIRRVPYKFYDPDEANLWFSLFAANPENPGRTRLASESYAEFLERNLAQVLNRSSQQDLGRNVYLSVCAGCHGFEGHAAYAGAPSFASGDRLDLPDAVLENSVINGLNTMPAWRGRLSTQAVQQVIAYLRDRFGYGPRQTVIVIEETEPEDKQLALGEKIYLQICGGCHGFNGIAWYVNSPSFALRQRLHKSDAELAHSINNGLGAMPSWEYMLRPQHIEALVKFIRTLPDSYESGIASELRRPDGFLRFRPSGETGETWTGDDYR